MNPELDLKAPESIADVRDRLLAEGVKYLFGAYVDAHGVPKSKCVPIEHIESMAGGSELYTVGALDGMGELGPNEDECEGHPDLSAVTVLPWDTRYAIAPADLMFHGEPYTHDCRRVLKRQLAEAAALGYGFNMGVEPEVYVLRPVNGHFEPWVQEDVVNAPTRGYDLETTMLADAFLEPMVEYMRALGWDVYSFDHEGGDGQYEFEFRYCDALQMADRMILFRLLAKHVARRLGCIASFMPKPFPDNFGSGAHLNMSLADIDTGENRFDAACESTNGNERAGYTKLAYQFAAGMLEHAGAIAAISCPTVNSYKRLMPVGLMNHISWAPVYRAFGHNNRTLMCRLPMNRRCVELRAADSACNFYLAAALALGAGLDGIRRELDPGDPVNIDTYKKSDAELAELGVHRLPKNLGEAVDELERDELAREVLGEELHASYVALKRAEWDAYNTVISPWELEQYLQRW
jgi:glutamine synthetase